MPALTVAIGGKADIRLDVASSHFDPSLNIRRASQRICPDSGTLRSRSAKKRSGVAGHRGV